MKRIPAAHFKEQCLSFLDNVGPEGIVVTKHGRPVAKLLPVACEPKALIGSLRSKIKVKGSLLSTRSK